MTRSEEIRRLEQYAKGLGIIVRYERHKRGNKSAAQITVLDRHTSEMVIFYDSRTTKTDIVLRIIHELGHQLSWVYRGRNDPQSLIDALSAESLRKPGDPPIPKHQRKLIYEMEKHDTQYWDNIITELGINLKEEIVKIEKELDIWIYRHYYLKGGVPTLAQIRKKYDQLARKYAKKKRKKC